MVTDNEQPEPEFRPPTHWSPSDVARQRPERARHHLGQIYSAPNGYRTLELDVFVPENAGGLVPCVVWVHGGAWLFGSRVMLPEHWPAASLFQVAIDAGLAVATIDYRHASEAPFPAQVNDGFAALRWLGRYGAELGIDANRLGIWGESAGGHLASLIALIRDAELQGTDGVTDPAPAIRAAVSFYGVHDVDTMPAFLDSMPAELLEHLTEAHGGPPPAPLDVLLGDAPWPRAEANRLASPVHHVHPDAPPFLLVHGEVDRGVPISQSEEFAAELRAAGVPVTVVRVPGADHVFEGTDPRPRFPEAVSFLLEHL